MRIQLTFDSANRNDLEQLSGILAVLSDEVNMPRGGDSPSKQPTPHRQGQVLFDRGDGGPGDLRVVQRPDPQAEARAQAQQQEVVVRGALNGNAADMRRLIGDAQFANIVAQVGGNTANLALAASQMTVQQAQRMNEMFQHVWDAVSKMLDERQRAEGERVREDTDRNIQEIDRLEAFEHTG